jgi:hypothetical protein
MISPRATIVLMAWNERMVFALSHCRNRSGIHNEKTITRSAQT